MNVLVAVDDIKGGGGIKRLVIGRNLCQSKTIKTMNLEHLLSRRDFVGALAAAGSAWAWEASAAGADEPAASTRFPLLVFSKAFQHLDYAATADLVAEVGWDGLECPVRRGGQVVPERVEDDLPKLVAALKKCQRDLAIITTDIRSATDPFTERVLRAAGRLGIRRYRLGPMRYREDRPLPDQFREVRAQLRDLAALNKELGLTACFQNHSGRDTMGAPVWDIYEMIQGLDPRQVGACFDLGHATVEGGYAWPLHARLMEPSIQAVYVKDFVWKKSGPGWEAAWCPLGEGMIDARFFSWLKKTAFRGPISQHFEYALGDRPEMVRYFRQDLAKLKAWLAGKAG